MSNDVVRLNNLIDSADQGLIYLSNFHEDHHDAVTVEQQLEIEEIQSQRCCCWLSCFKDPFSNPVSDAAKVADKVSETYLQLAFRLIDRSDAAREKSLRNSGRENEVEQGRIKEIVNDIFTRREKITKNLAKWIGEKRASESIKPILQIASIILKKEVPLNEISPLLKVKLEASDFYWIKPNREKVEERGAIQLAESCECEMSALQYTESESVNESIKQTPPDFVP